MDRQDTAVTGVSRNVIAFADRGQLTKADYVSTLIPAVEMALASHDRLRLYYELGADCADIDADAIAEDFKIGMWHRSVDSFEMRAKMISSSSSKKDRQS